MACAHQGALTTQRGSNSRLQRNGHRPIALYIIITESMQYFELERA